MIVGKLDVLTTKVVSKYLKNKKANLDLLRRWHIRFDSFWELTVAHNQISQHHRKEAFVSIKVPKWSKSYLVCYKWRAWLLNNSKLNTFLVILVWFLIWTSSFCHSYYYIDIWRMNDMYVLSLCCFNNGQKCKLKKNEQKKQGKKLDISIWKHNIGFLNFVRTITFTILATFQNFGIIILSTLRSRTTYDVD